MRAALLAFALSLVSGLARADPASGIKRCGVEHIDRAAEQKTQEFIKLYGQAAVTSSTNKVIPVYWHTITSSKGEGAINSTQLAAQMKVLNDGYAGTGFSFELKGSDTTVNNTWFHNLSPLDYEVQTPMKTKLHKGGAGTLNLYSANLTDGTLGFATFPAWYKGNPILDGVVLHFDSLPSGSMGHKFSQGKTAVHETGHWLGLYHTFQGNDCNDPQGDYVTDTPAESESTDGCPVKKDSCPGKEGLDPIHNYMDYSWDSCMTGFTKGQIQRMHTVSALYRGL